MVCHCTYIFLMAFQYGGESKVTRHAAPVPWLMWWRCADSGPHIRSRGAGGWRVCRGKKKSNDEAITDEVRKQGNRRRCGVRWINESSRNNHTAPSSAASPLSSHGPSFCGCSHSA
jgi:hypothetical protein